MLKIATWNVNSIKVRLDAVLDWLDTQKVDVLALQETKTLDEYFPESAFKERGYHVAFTGQKTYNGVATISRKPQLLVHQSMPHYDDEQKRFLVTQVEGVYIVNVYVPNGASLESDKYQYKLQWLAHLTRYLSDLKDKGENVVLLGDFNIAPKDEDVHDPKVWEGSVLVSPPERAALEGILDLGFCDGFRLFNQPEASFSWWDYRAAGFRRNRGLRIDLVLLSKSLQSSCLQSEIDIHPRKQERPSDHAPVWVMLNC